MIVQPHSVQDPVTITYMLDFVILHRLKVDAHGNSVFFVKRSVNYMRPTFTLQHLIPLGIP